MAEWAESAESGPLTESDDLVNCEGCPTLLDAGRCVIDVEGCYLCDDCADAARVPLWHDPDPHFDGCPIRGWT